MVLRSRAHASTGRQPVVRLRGEDDFVRLLDRTERRLRVARLLRSLAVVLPIVATIAAAFVLVVRLHTVGRSFAMGAAFVVSVVASALLVVAYVLPVARTHAAALLDGHFGLHDRLGSALSFRGAHGFEGSLWMQAAVLDAYAHASVLDAASAVSLVPPRGLLWTGVPLLLLALALRVPEKARPAVPFAEGATTAPIDASGDLSPGALAAFEEDVRSLAERGGLSEETARVLLKTAADLKSGALGREGAFLKLSELEAHTSPRAGETKDSSTRPPSTPPRAEPSARRSPDARDSLREKLSQLRDILRQLPRSAAARAARGEPAAGQAGQAGQAQEERPVEARSAAGGAEAVAARAGIGHAHQEAVGGPTAAMRTSHDLHVAGKDIEGGESRSSVIESTARGGFAARSYPRVYSEYRPAFEDAIERGDIPGGYRVFVRRYFQSIRPDEGADRVQTKD